MKPSHLFRRASLHTFVTFAFAGAALAFPENFYEGFYLDSSNSSYLISYESDYLLQHRNNVEFSTYNGGLVLYSPTPPTSPTNLDGGLTLLGNPVSIVLEAAADDSNFGIWKSSAWWGNSTPIFKIEGATGNTTFTGSDVAINGGSLSVGEGLTVTGNQTVSGSLSAGGSPVITAASAGSVLTGQNFVQLASGGVLNIASTTASTSSSTGALTVAGGIGVVKDANINGLTIGKGLGSILSNTAFGRSTLSTNSTGSGNTGMGSFALMYNTTGNYNTVVGALALQANSIGGYNAAVGYRALNANAGNNNVAFGYNAMGYKVNGTDNIAIGHNAGLLQSDSSNITSIIGGIFIGANTKGSVAGNTDSIVIGTGAISDGPNTTVIGNTSTLSTRLEGETKSESLRVSGNTVLEGNAEIVGNTVLGGSVTLAEAQGDISMGDYQ